MKKKSFLLDTIIKYNKFNENQVFDKLESKQERIKVKKYSGQSIVPLKYYKNISLIVDYEIFS